MQTGIRVIKRDALNERTAVSTNTTTKSDRERERETVATVKIWIADWQDRKQSLQKAAESIISSIGGRREIPSKRFSPGLI